MPVALSKNKFFDIPQDVLDTYELKGEKARQAEDILCQEFKIDSADTEAFYTKWSDGRTCSYKY
jgi:hypothetical protein